MAAILQKTFWNALYCMEIFGFWLKFHWNMSTGTQMTRWANIGSDNGPAYWRIYASLGRDVTSSYQCLWPPTSVARRGTLRSRIEPWWRHQMETFSVLLALREGKPPVTGRFPSQRPVTRCFDVSFDVHLNKRLSKQSRRRWFETPSRSVWRHCNVMVECDV